MPQPEGPFPDCHAIVLAAGDSARFDGAKLLADFRGEPLVRWAVRAALASRVAGVTVILGSRSEDVRDALAPFDDRRLRPVVNPDWREGLAASLRTGLSSLPSAADAAVIFLGDMPNLRPGLADAVLEQVRNGAPAALPYHAGMPGHPVAIARALFGRLSQLDGDRGARAVLEQQAGVVRVETDDPGCIQDVDTRQDLDGLA